MAQKGTWYWLGLGDDSRFALATPIEVLKLAKTPGPAGSPARRQIVQLYRKDIYTIARHEAANAEDAKDLTQDFCLKYLDEKAYEGINPEQRGFRKYLTGWIKFAARSLRKKRRRTREVSYEASAAAERVTYRGRSPGDMVDMLLTRSRVDHILDTMKKQLGSQAWEVFDAVHLQREGDGEATQDALAARLGATRAHVRALIQVARTVFVRCFVKLVAPELYVPEQMDEELASPRGSWMARSRATGCGPGGGGRRPTRKTPSSKGVTQPPTEGTPLRRDATEALTRVTRLPTEVTRPPTGVTGASNEVTGPPTEATVASIEGDMPQDLAGAFHRHLARPARDRDCLAGRRAVRVVSGH